MMVPRGERLNQILHEAGVTGKLMIFGSRATGTATAFSDLDLLVDGPAPLPLEVLSRLELLLSESDLPYRVDIVEARRSSPAFLEAIRSDLKLWDTGIS